MKRFSLILASLVLLLGGKASAFVGGPFDNGDFSSLLDNSGVYQVAFRFSNGSGFAQFGNNVDTTTFSAQTGGAATTITATFSVLNRSMFYYKGVSYLGTCYGMVDHERKFVQGVTNGNSDQLTTTALNPLPSTGGNPGAVVNATQTLNSNGNIGLTCNSEFVCKITKSYPVLRFNGTGEVTIINPSQGATIYSELAAGLTSLVSPTSVTPPLNNPTQPSSAAIQAYSAAVIALLNASSSSEAISAEQIRKTSDRVKMFAFGSRVFFVSRRR
jgi:hypothetical protein